MATQLERLIDSQSIREKEDQSQLKIALEGPSCAGKSTITARAAELGAETILEYSEYVPSATRDFPKFPPKDSQAAKDAFLFFLELEEKREQDSRQREDGLILLDRSIFTLLGFEAGASQLTGIDILPWATDILSSKKEILVPDHIIYMDVSSEITRSRATAGNLRIPSFMFDPRFNEGFRNFFMNLKNIRPDYVSIVDASKPSEDVFREIQRLTQQS